MKDKEPVSVTIERLADDPLCLRASIGGDRTNGYYCRYRGELPDIAEMLRHVSHAMSTMEKAVKIGVPAPTIQPDPPPHGSN